MKKLILFLVIIVKTTPLWAGPNDVEGNIVRRFSDPVTGVIVVETEYTVRNSEEKIHGRTRYDENSFTTQAEFKAKVEADVRAHCKALITRIPENKAFIENAMKSEQKKRTDPLIDQNSKDFTHNILGLTFTETTATVKFKDKEIEVRANKTGVVRDAPAITPIPEGR